MNENQNKQAGTQQMTENLPVSAEDILMNPEQMHEPVVSEASAQSAALNAPNMHTPAENAPTSTHAVPSQTAPENQAATPQTQASAPQTQVPAEEEEKPQTDLLSQIAREDELAEANQKEKTSLYADLVHFLIQLNLLLSASMKKNPLVFKVLNWIWAAFVSVILLGGFGAFCVLAYIYLTFPQHVRNYLAANGIVADDLKHSDFSFSNVEIKNVRDARGSYEIGSVILQYTISDLLKKQIKSVTLDGVKVFVKENQNGFDFGQLPAILLKLNQYNQKSSIRISSLGLTNASVEISGQKFNLPIAFSMTGVYEHGADINIPIWIKEDYLTLKGSLNIKGSPAHLEWILDLSSGVLSLPGQSPENITGKITFTTRNNTLDSIAGEVRLFFGENFKHFDLKLTKQEDRLFAGDLKLNLRETNQYDKTKPINSLITAHFDGIDFKNGIHSIESTKPIQLVVQSFQKDDFSITGASARLLGTLKCQNFACSYQLKAPSVVNASQTQFMLNRNMIQTDQGLSFVLMPIKKKDIFAFKNGQIKLDFVMQRMRLLGFKNVRANRISFRPELILVDGTFNMNAPQRRLAIEIEGLDYSAPEYSVKGGILQINDLFADAPQMKFSAKAFELKETDLIKRPFELVLNHANQRTVAEVGLENGVIKASFAGTVHFATGEVNGSVFVPTFDLGQIKTPLSDISSLFAPSVRQPSGQVAVLGSFNWLNSRQITGPLYVSLRDFGVQIGNTTVSGLNTVITLSSLEPLVSQGVQQVFIQEMKGILPLKNISLTYQLDNQFFYLTSFSGYLGNAELVADSALIPHRASSSTLVLRNSNVDMASFADYLSFPVRLSGKANLSLPIELKHQQVDIKNGELRFMNALIAQEKDAHPHLSDLLENQDSYVARNGLMLLNSTPDSLQTEIQVILDEKDTGLNAGKGSFRKTYEYNLNDLIKNLPTDPVPVEISRKQELFDI